MVVYVERMPESLDCGRSQQLLSSTPTQTPPPYSLGTDRGTHHGSHDGRWLISVAEKTNGWGVEADQEACSAVSVKMSAEEPPKFELSW